MVMVAAGVLSSSQTMKVSPASMFRSIPSTIRSSIGQGSCHWSMPRLASQAAAWSRKATRVCRSFQVAQLVHEAVAVPGEDGLGEAHRPLLGVAGAHVGEHRHAGREVEGLGLVGAGHTGGDLVA
jgi:hypothetical protein